MESRPRLRKILWGLICAGLLLGLHPVAATAGTLSLVWDSNTETDLAGYKVHVGTTSQTYMQTIDVGHVTTYTVSNLSDGQTYFSTVTAYDIFGNESGFSNEVSATIAAPPLPITGEKYVALPDGTRKVIVRWIVRSETSKVLLKGRKTIRKVAESAADLKIAWRIDEAAVLQPALLFTRERQITLPDGTHDIDIKWILKAKKGEVLLKGSEAVNDVPKSATDLYIVWSID